MALRSPVEGITRDSWDRYLKQVPLDRAAIECIHVRRRAEHHTIGIDPAPSGQAGYFLLGMKSSFGDSWN
jgi:hypothetical protein